MNRGIHHKSFLHVIFSIPHSFSSKIWGKPCETFRKKIMNQDFSNEKLPFQVICGDLRPSLRKSAGNHSRLSEKTTYTEQIFGLYKHMA